MSKFIKQIEIEEAVIGIRSDEIMHIHIKIEQEVLIQHSINIIAARTKLADGKAYPMLYTTEGGLSTPSPEVKKNVASEERSALVLADAFVVKSLPQRIAAKIYISFNQPSMPTKFFSKESEAINWLKKFR